MARRDLTDEQALPRVAARPITELDEVVLERICKAILAMSSAHALGMEYQGAEPDDEDVRSAIEWFRENSEAFQAVCLAAKINSSFARRVVLARLSGAEADA